MDAKQFTVIPGQKGNGKITLTLLALLALALFLQGLIISDLCSTLSILDLELCDLRRKLGRIPLAGQILKFTGTVSVTPEPPPTVVSAPPPPRDFQTENT